jgi:hypothetical protein
MVILPFISIIRITHRLQLNWSRPCLSALHAWTHFLFQPHMDWALLLFSFYSWGNQGTEMLRKFPKVTLQVEVRQSDSRAQVQNHCVLSLSHRSTSVCGLTGAGLSQKTFLTWAKKIRRAWLLSTRNPRCSFSPLFNNKLVEVSLSTFILHELILLKNSYIRKITHKKSWKRWWVSTDGQCVLPTSEACCLVSAGLTGSAHGRGG